MPIACLSCGRPYPDSGVPFRCAHCGGLFDEQAPLTAPKAQTRAPGIWRYISPPGGPGTGLSLGEGNTPLVPASVSGRRIFFKCEYANPTGSFKDRGSAVIASLLLSRGVTRAIEDSSGNAGASFAAYAAKAHIRTRIYGPSSASGPKRGQVESYGAEYVAVDGARAESAQAVLTEANAGATYASHGYLPQNLEGYATCAYELVEQLDGAPGTVLVPAGQGGLLLGLARGFEALRRARRTDHDPVLIGVQAAACAPLAALFEVGVTGLGFVTEGPTVAEGVRVLTPLRAHAVIRAVDAAAGASLRSRKKTFSPGVTH